MASAVSITSANLRMAVSVNDLLGECPAQSSRAILNDIVLPVASPMMDRLLFVSVWLDSKFAALQIADTEVTSARSTFIVDAPRRMVSTKVETSNSVSKIATCSTRIIFCVKVPVLSYELAVSRDGY